MRRSATVHYQIQAREFRVGDWVYPIATGNPFYGGRVVGVWPAIGMVDVKYAHGTSRSPVEDLLIDRSLDIGGIPLGDAYPAPAGDRHVPVPEGPVKPYIRASASRVASSHEQRTALYWAGPNRKFRPSRSEIDTDSYLCPRCEKPSRLHKVVYKREEGKSEKLLCCRRCLFLTRLEDIVLPVFGTEGSEPEDVSPAKDAFEDYSILTQVPTEGV